MNCVTGDIRKAGRRKSMTKIADSLDMTLAVYRVRKALTQTHKQTYCLLILYDTYCGNNMVIIHVNSKHIPAKP